MTCYLRSLYPPFLLNPQLIFYPFALGGEIVVLRIILSFLAGILAGYLFKNDFFTFPSYLNSSDRDLDPNMVLRYLKNVWRNLKIGFPYLVIGIALSALFQRYMPSTLVEDLLGEGAVIPLTQLWIYQGMGKESALAFMNVGQALRLTNISALKMALSMKKLLLFILFIFAFSIGSGYLVDILL